MIIQLCFQVKDEEHNNNVIEKLKELRANMSSTDKVVSCHLPRHIVEEKKWSTTMVDALEDIFGSQYECKVKADTFEKAMLGMCDYRRRTAMTVDKILVVGEQSIANIALEIELFTSNKVQFI